ncbi:apoptosis-inducing factor 1, mitochondrial-like [Choristoneura fumiferana]|uniref:apoptosis-inducing factor 1, mitochondrial-like n=1 Tax=Choristoneura fumiferana TaxID=7141 RepID=UPI003D15DE41
MLGNPIRCCCHARHLSPNVFDITNSNLKNFIAGFGTHKACCSKDKGCSNVPQTENRNIEPWPKPDPPPPSWRCECPRDPQPVNYDPYRIKVPEIVVPPLPGGEAKPMIDCAKKAPCSALPVPPPEPCPPVPRKPFPWIYVWVTAAFMTTLGLIYKYWVYTDLKAKSGASKPVWQPVRVTRRPPSFLDLPACVQYLIVGTGAAAWGAYKSIMEHDKTAKVFFISKEDSLPYARPPMSKYMWLNPEPPDLQKLNYVKDGKRLTMFYTPCTSYLDPVVFYRKKIGPAVAAATGYCVTRLDAENHVVYVKTLSGEQPMYYERCLLAIGSKAKNLDIFRIAPKPVRERVCTLRTVRDLEVAYRRVKDAKHVTIIGGGVLGCELAWYLAKMNNMPKEDVEKEPIEIVMMYKDGGILSNIIPEYLGEWAAEKIRCQGVKTMPKTTPHDAFISKDGRLELTLNNGNSYVTDYAFVCVGTKARVEIAEASNLEHDPINGGIMVNTELEARKHLYVAGDGASYYSQWKDTRMRLEHYANAYDQGTIAGANMTGYWEPCNIEPTYWLKLDDAIQMQVVGEVGACMPIIALFKPCRAEDLPPEKDKKKTSYPCYKDAAEYKARYMRGLLCYIRNETIVGFVFWNMPPIDDRKDVATEILRARPHYKEMNLVAELLGFPETQCVYLTAEEHIEGMPCIKKRKYE